MKCSNCNNEIDETTVFCPFCGKKVENQDSVQEPQVTESKENIQESVEQNNIQEEKAPENIENSGQVVQEESTVSPVNEEAVSVSENNTDTAAVSQSSTVSSVSDVTEAATIEDTAATKPKKRHSIITFAIILAAILVIGIIAVVIVFATKGAEDVYETAIKSAVLDMYSSDFLGSESADVSTTLKFSTDIDELSEVIDGLALQAEVIYDTDQDLYQIMLGVEKSDTTYLSAVALLNLEQDSLYLGEESLYDELIEIPMSESQSDQIEEALENIFTGDTDVTKKAAKKIYKAINNNLSEELYSSQSTVLNINGKDKKVTDNVLSFTQDDLSQIIKSVVNDLKMDNEFLDYYEDRSQIEDALDSLEDYAEELSGSGTLTMHVYTSGLFKSFVGFKVEVLDSYDDGTIIEVMKTSSKEYSITVKSSDSGSLSDVLGATLVINKSTKTAKDYVLSISTDEGTLAFEFAYNGTYNKAISTVNTTGAVNYEDVDYNTLYSNFTDSALYDIYEDYVVGALESLGVVESSTSYSTSNSSTNTNVTLTGSQAYVETYDSDVIVFEIPASFETRYSGVTYQRFSKTDNQKSTVYIDIDCNYYTLDEYRESLEYCIEYYNEYNENYEVYYVDPKITDEEEIEVAGITYYTRTITYSDPYGDNYKMTYYYTYITDKYTYSVTIEDYSDADIVTDSELEKLLDIDVTYAK